MLQNCTRNVLGDNDAHVIQYIGWWRSSWWSWRPDAFLVANGFLKQSWASTNSENRIAMNFLFQGKSQHICRLWYDKWPQDQLSLNILNGRTSYRKISEDSKPRDSSLHFSNRTEIWEAPRQQRHQDGWQIVERCNQYNIQSPSFETWRESVNWQKKVLPLSE